MDTAKLIQDALTLFVVINPIGAVPHYLALTRSLERPERLRVARRACMIAAVILLVFIAIGEIVLDGIGVQMPSFRVAGGLVLLLIGLKTVLNTEPQHPFAKEGAGHDIAVFPMATPFLAGPGAILASVLLTENGKFGIADQALTATIVVLILAATYVVLMSADLLQRRLGNTGALVMSRIFGLVLAALAMQTMLEGLRPFLESLR